MYHQIQRGAELPLWRKPQSCADARYLADVWAQRAHEARVKTARWKANAVARERRALYEKWRCIHEHEGAWDAVNPAGYYGGLQMDTGFQRTYGSEHMAKWGTADHWPVWAQLQAAERAYHGYHGFGGRGFSPWPNTRRMCGV